MTIPLSILDLAPIAPGQTPRESFAASVALAQTAEKHGYTRVWYAEHHNMPTIASSATSILVGHVAAQTSTIRLGAGGVMLPNHSPLVIAEQFGTLAALFPDASTWAWAVPPAATRPLRGRCGGTRAPQTNSPRTCSSCRRTFAAHRSFPACRPCPAPAPTCPCTSSGHRSSAPVSPPRSVCHTRSHRISRPTRCTRPSPPTVATSSRRRSWPSRTSSWV